MRLTGASPVSSPPVPPMHDVIEIPTAERPSAVAGTSMIDVVRERPWPFVVWTAMLCWFGALFVLVRSLLLPFAISFLDSQRVWAFAACAVLILATGELMGVTLAALGLWYWLSRGHRRDGALIFCAGLGWSLICIKLIIPHFSGEDSQFYRYFASVGGSPEDVVRTAVTDPGKILDALATGRDLLYIVALAAPLGGLLLLAPGTAAVALPQLAANALSSIDAHTDPRGHVVAGIVPFVVAASVLGLSRLKNARREGVAMAVLAFSVAYALVLGSWAGLAGLRPPMLEHWYQGTPSTYHFDALRDAVSLIRRSDRRPQRTGPAPISQHAGTSSASRNSPKRSGSSST